MFIVRDFESTDQDSVRSLIQAGLSERWGTDFDESYNHDLDDIAATYVATGASVLVIEHSGELVATGILLRLEAQVGQLVRISVAGDQRRLGLGRLVVEELIDRARSYGMKELRILADTPWHSAVELYRACGFDVISRDDADTSFQMRLA